jgi:hypothetical protein
MSELPLSTSDATKKTLCYFMNLLEPYHQIYTYDTGIVKFNHTADSIALVIIDRVLCGVGTFLVHGLESVMREIFGNVIEKIPTKLADLSAPEVAHPILQRRRSVTL